jgi:hypothetical protein
MGKWEHLIAGYAISMDFIKLYDVLPLEISSL